MLTDGYSKDIQAAKLLVQDDKKTFYCCYTCQTRCAEKGEAVPIVEAAVSHRFVPCYLPACSGTGLNSFRRQRPGLCRGALGSPLPRSPGIGRVGAAGWHAVAVAGEPGR